MDAPIHFGDGVHSADQIPAEHLVVPLAIVDIRAKAQGDADAQLTPGDLKAFEAVHGPIADGACVAMLSGWDARAGGHEFRNADAEGVMHFPGFHVEAVHYLMGERNAVGIAVDTLSLDYGKSADFATHYAWLPSNRWGLEAVANLAELPPTGATLVVGSPKIKGATGGPSRVFATALAPNRNFVSHIAVVARPRSGRGDPAHRAPSGSLRALRALATTTHSWVTILRS
jgi:kynurenine formamidase